MTQPPPTSPILDVVRRLGPAALAATTTGTGPSAADVLAVELAAAFRRCGWRGPYALAEVVRAAYARSNVLLDPGDGAAVSEHLAEVADKAAGSLRNALLTGDGDFAALSDLLACVSALTEICGSPRTPTAVDVGAALTAELGRNPLQAFAGRIAANSRLASNSPPAEWRPQVAAHAAYMHAAKLARDLAEPAPNSPAGPDITPDMLGRMADLLERRAAEAVQTASPPDPLGPKAAAFRRFAAAVADLTNEQAIRLEAAADAAYDTDDTDPDGNRRETAAERAYRAAVAAGRWGYAQGVVERAPGAAFDPKLALLVVDLIAPEDFAVLTGPWFAAFGRWPWQGGDLG